MDNLRIETAQMLLPEQETQRLQELLLPELHDLQHAAEQGYKDARASINLPVDEALRNHLLECAAHYADVDTLVVIGIGGSNLGTMAIHDALKGEYHNLVSRKKLLFADTVDPEKLHAIIEIMRADFLNGKRVLLVPISKSGGTTETTALFETLLYELQQQKTNWQDDVVVITGENSKFWQYAQKHNIFCLTLPDTVGGRFSVLSAVGLFPLAVMGIDIVALCKGAAQMRKHCLMELAHNPAAKSAACIYHHYLQKKNIHDTFVFSTRLESFGKWQRQLMGESVGKEHNLHGERVHIGITPTTSIGSTDLHSMAQLFLGGPYDKTFTLVDIDYKTGPRIPSDEEFNALVSHIQGREMQELMAAIVQGVCSAFTKQHRPYMRITLPRIDAYSMGELLQLKMFEIIFLAHLMQVNPFDQPNVEDYKIETKKALEQAALPQQLPDVYIGSDHAGFMYKEDIKKHLAGKGLLVEDVGAHHPDTTDDYPVYAKAVGTLVADTDKKGILICGSGTGMVIAANKIAGVRAQVAYDEYSARMGRQDNDTNVLCLRAREANEDTAMHIVDTWLETSFSQQERHKKRLDELSELDACKQ